MNKNPTHSENTLISTLELNIEELKKELMEERKSNQKLKNLVSADDPWKEIAMEMAQALSEIKQISLSEVLNHFNAPIDDS